MAFSPSSPISGAAVTGLTTPTYTLTADNPPSPQGKQYYVSALGGTQTGVVPHSASRPFTLSAFKPAALQQLGAIVPATGALSRVPVNTYKWITRKSVIPLSGQPGRVMVITTVAEVPAGADTADAANLAAGFSAHAGLLAGANTQGMYDTVISGAV
jgi:hypothetical protein